MKKNMDILSLFDQWNFDYKKYKDVCLKIGDVSALRHKKGIPFRRDYERGLLLLGLAIQYKCENFVEIGTGRGYVAACVSLCSSIKRIYTIDNTSSKDAIKSLSLVSREEFKKINFIEKNSFKLEDGDVPSEIDLSFIDGEHSYKAVKHDFNFFKNKSKIIVFDDYRNKHAGVKKFIDQIKLNKLIIHTDGWVYKNKMIAKHGDADRVIDGKEYKSGQVIVFMDDLWSNNYF